MEPLSSSKWHLRFGVTPNCNFECEYCNPDGYEMKPTLPETEVEEILEAAKINGIDRVHWTGGEPTFRNDFPKLMKSAKELGFTKQIITTNGYRLHNIIDECIENGLTRVIVSLDTLKSDRFLELTHKNMFYNVLKGLEDSVKKLESSTKISAVTMKSTLPELKDFVKYAQDINSKEYKGNLIIKLNQFFPSNPAQLKKRGQDYWTQEFTSEQEILETLAQIGSLTPLERTNIEGDNPTYNYYIIGDTGVQVGVLSLFSQGYPCGGCHKLRIQPNGNVSVCLNLYDQPSLVGKSVNEKAKIMADVINYRENSINKDMPNRRHYRGQLGELRFGKLGEPKDMEYFYNILQGKRK
ncbi:MAG: GTP 3',8-cyclase MoaA [Candidatus Woesearchaeota archaeon]|jgi:cyclic pyranopterin phosphate synthase